MRIVADENIPLLDEFFARFGAIERLPGRAIEARHVRDADILLVRSVTTVNRALLEDSRVRFIGTCTIGTDHLDLPYLTDSDIAWANAPGCNARGVVDYVLGSLLSLAESEGVRLSEKVYGVIGAGQVGGRLVKVLQDLGWKLLVCDPPRQRIEGGDFVDLNHVLAESDVISLHTPLTRSGDHPTYHLMDERRLRMLKPGAWLINASRGAVVDNTALRDLLAQGERLKVVLDVWENEPLVDVALAERCHLVTPHVAGYSLDGKLRGTAQIYRACCQYLQTAEQVSLDDLQPASGLAELTLNAPVVDPDWALALICRSVYDPRRDNADFRRGLTGTADDRRQYFDSLRRHYPVRREIDGLRVKLLNASASSELHKCVRALGAIISTEL